MRSRTEHASSAARSARAHRPTLVQLTDVSVHIAHSAVLRNINLEVPAGQVVGITGPNGSGKSTLLETLATLRRPTAGDGYILGSDLSAPAPPAVRRRICLVGHQPALYAQLSLRENLRLLAALLGRPAHVADDALAVVGLQRAAGRRADRCSLGMARRADLARALVVDPSLLLLDEAHAGLDPAAAELVSHLISTVSAAGGATVVVAHDWPLLPRIADEMLAVSDGRLSSTGTLS